jgi:hypothetical protein
MSLGPSHPRGPMNSLVRDMMTTEVVTVERSTPFKEIVARWPSAE